MNAENGYVLLPQPIEEEAHDLFRKRGIRTVTAKDTKLETINPLLDEAHAVVLRTGIQFTRELVQKGGRLLTISRTGAGVDNVDVQAATDHGVVVTSSVGVNTASVAEHALALLLALAKQLPLMDREVRQGNFGIRYKNLPRDLKNKRLGVVGFGKIGAAFADLCHRALRMEVIAYDPYIDEAAKAKTASWAEFVSLDELFSSADAVSVHIPLTPETKGIVDLGRLKLMKPTSFLINTSRGGVINETDLVSALEAKLLAGAGLDVFEKEPPEKKSPLLAMENVILTPHSAALTEECVLEMAVKAVERVLDLLDGYIPECVQNPVVLNQEKWRGLRRR